jgi:beta-glucosidase
MKKKQPKVVLWSVLSVLFVILFVASIVGNTFANQYATTINNYLGTSYSKVVGSDADAIYYTSDFASEEEKLAYEEALCAQIEEEGAVLLKNDNNALPLAEGASISTFGRASVDLVYGGTGSGRVDVSTAPTLTSALTAQGINVNTELNDWYTSVADKYSRVLAGEISDNTAANTEFKVNEAPWSEVVSGAGDSFAAYGDAAVVVIGRSGGEGADLPDGDTSVGVSWSIGAEGDGNYLELSQEEKDMLAGLKELKDAGTFKSIIVLLNTSNAVELDFLNPDVCGVDYGVDSCLWIGDVGATGINGVVSILTGQVAPSGSLADTYWYDNLANPAVTNFYARPYDNYEDYGLLIDSSYGDDGVRATYSVYQEGIYLGYRYAETRYEDVVMNTANVGDYDYSKTVAYSFGYGISYVDFQYSNYQMTQDDDNFIITVDVTNLGDMDAKKSVQVWFQNPYTDYDKLNGIEKAAIELCGYTKVEVPAGQTVTATVTVPKTELRTYDSNNAKTYILDAGDYYFTVANGAHEAINNVLAAKGYTTADGMTDDGDASLTSKWTNDTLDTTVFSTSVTGATITNLFDQADPLKSENAPDGAENIKWLSRSDWTGTYPTGTYSLSVNDTLATALNHSNYDASEYADMEMPTTASGGDLNLSSFIGKDYDDPDWDELLDQLTYDEMVTTITLGFHNTAACESVSKPATKDENGPQGLSALLTGGTSAMAYTSEDVLVATMNVDLIEDVGRCIGNDCLDLGYSGLYGPGVNMHRTPYSGRNFEYYSEDPFASAETCVAEVKGIQSKGVYVYLKHVALNDSETCRMGVQTWINEQAAREIYLEVADRAITEGEAWCVMSGFNRWGALWCGEYKELQTDYLRGELGMRGMSITDYSGSSRYMDLVDGLAAGSDIWDSPDTTFHTTLARTAGYDQDPYIVSNMRNAMHRILYTVVNSNAMNTWTADTRIVACTPWWQTAIYAWMGISGVLGILSIVKLVLAIKAKRAAK